METRTLLAGDLPGVFGATADILIDENMESAAPQVHEGTQVGEQFYMLAQDRIGDYELWRTDGAQDGTTRVSEIYGNLPRDGLFWRCCNLGSAGDRLYLVVERIETNARLDLLGVLDQGTDELWTSDGTDAGTIPLVELDEIWRGAQLESQMLDHQNSLVLATSTYYDSFLDRLWTSDGTPTGTSAYFESESTPWLAPIQELVPFDGQYFFLGASYDPSGNEFFGLWSTNPDTLQTELVKEFNGSQQEGESPRYLTVSNGWLLFAADGGAGQELFRSDGTAAGTVQVKDIRVGESGSNANTITVTAEGTILLADDGDGERVWRTDGTEAGTIPYDQPNTFRAMGATNLEDGSARLELREFGDLSVSGLREAGDLTLFYRYADEQLSLWATNGTAEESQLLGPDLKIVGLFDGQVLVAHDGTVSAVDAADLSLEPRFVLPTTTLGSNPVALAATQDALFYVSESDGQLREFEDTAAAPDVLPGDDFIVYNEAGQLLTDSQVLNDELYVFGQRGLLKRDAETEEFVELIPRDSLNLNPFATIAMTAGDDALYVAGIQGAWPSSSIALWQTDGTPEGTELFGEIPNEGYDFHPRMAYAGGQLYFLRRGSQRLELWQSDGTADGTHEIAFLSLSSRDVEPSNLEVFGDWLYFGDGEGGLWRSDGRSAELQLVHQFAVHTDACCGDGPNIYNLTTAGDQLFFTVDDGVHGNELWVTDGTTDGTKLAVDIRPGRNPSYPSDLSVWKDQLVFAANDGQHGRELWSISLAEVELPGDVDGNGAVEFADFLVLAGHFGQEVQGGSADGDLNLDGAVDFDDFVMLAENFGRKL